MSAGIGCERKGPKPCTSWSVFHYDGWLFLQPSSGPGSEGGHWASTLSALSARVGYRHTSSRVRQVFARPYPSKASKSSKSASSSIDAVTAILAAEDVVGTFIRAGGVGAATAGADGVATSFVPATFVSDLIPDRLIFPVVRAGASRTTATGFRGAEPADGVPNLMDLARFALAPTIAAGLSLALEATEPDAPLLTPLPDAVRGLR